MVESFRCTTVPVPVSGRGELIFVETSMLWPSDIFHISLHIHSNVLNGFKLFGKSIQTSVCSGEGNRTPSAAGKNSDLVRKRDENIIIRPLGMLLIDCISLSSARQLASPN